MELLKFLKIRLGSGLIRSAAIGMSLVLVGGACKFPFETRTPEPPRGQKSNWIPPTAANLVLTNMEFAIRERNSLNYLRCLSDSAVTGKRFRFNADPLVSKNYPTLFSSWNKSNEESYINQLFVSYLPKDSISQIQLVFQRENVYQDSTIFLYNYKLKIGHTYASDQCPRLVEGQAEFRLIRNELGEWSIYHWTDYRTGEKETWSQIKACLGG